MSRPPARSLAAGALALVAGCQVSPPPPSPPIPTVSRSQANRFALEGPEHDKEPSPLDLVGQPTPIVRLMEPGSIPPPPEPGPIGDPSDQVEAQAPAGPEGAATPEEVQAPGPPQEPEGAQESEGTDPDPGAPDELQIEDVLLSVERNFPLILAALEQVEIAEGKLLAARGGFDLVLGAKGAAALDGFYQNERLNVSLEQPTALWGASLVGGYRIGSGDFAEYDEKAKTLTDGEFRAGVSVPLLQGGRIDRRRLAVWQARLAREQADPQVLSKRLEASRKAARVYWKWVATGQKFEVARRLLALAENRQEAIEVAVAEGQLAEIALVDNRRLIVERRNILFAAQRLLQESSIELSLYYRDAAGIPVVPDVSVLPREFPIPRNPITVLQDEDADLALKRRPEVLALQLERERRELQLELSRNTLLPKLDLGVLASQDVGDVVSDPDDKGPFEFDAFLRFEVPMQRRKAKGDTQADEAEIAKLDRNLQFVKDRIVTEVQDAASALTQTYLRVEQVRENVELAGQLEEAERLQLREGESDLLRVNLREQQTARAASAMIDVLAEHFRSLADYRAVLGLPYDEVLAGRAVGGGLREE